MTQGQKDLLLKDLCARLPYGVRAEILNQEDTRREVVVSYGNICYIPEIGKGWWKECKPYLFPLSSMTEEQKKEYANLLVYTSSVERIQITGESTYDWLNKNMFDWRGLISMGLAEDATGLNIY